MVYKPTNKTGGAPPYITSQLPSGNLLHSY